MRSLQTNTQILKTNRICKINLSTYQCANYPTSPLPSFSWYKDWQRAIKKKILKKIHLYINFPLIKYNDTEIQNLSIEYRTTDSSYKYIFILLECFCLRSSSRSIHEQIAIFFKVKVFLLTGSKINNKPSLNTQRCT